MQSGPGVHSKQRLLHWLVLLCVVGPMFSGCGNSKDELRSLKEQNEKIGAQVKQLSEQVGRLEQGRNQLTDDWEKLSDKISQVDQKLENLTKMQADLTDENNEVKQKGSILSEEFSSLKTQNTAINKGLGNLINRFNQMGLWSQAPTLVATEVGSSTKIQSGKLSPCDAVIAYMKAVEDILRQQPRGPEQSKSLEELKNQFAPKMKGAPDTAIKGANDWVNGLIKIWERQSLDNSVENSMLKIIGFRDAVFNACGKSATEAGF